MCFECLFVFFLIFFYFLLIQTYTVACCNVLMLQPLLPLLPILLPYILQHMHSILLLLAAAVVDDAIDYATILSLKLLIVVKCVVASLMTLCSNAKLAH